MRNLSRVTQLPAALSLRFEYLALEAVAAGRNRAAEISAAVYDRDPELDQQAVAACGGGAARDWAGLALRRLADAGFVTYTRGAGATGWTATEAGLARLVGWAA